MKNYICFIVLIFVSSCATIYQTPDATSLAVKHKTIALLPSKVTITGRKNDNPEALKNQERNESYNFQASLYKWMLKRKTQGRLLKEIQDISYTNTKLKELGYFNNKPITMKELCDALEVDGLIETAFSITKPMSEGAALATGLLIGYWGATNKATASISIYDSTEGKLIWRYDHKYSGSVGTSYDDLVNALLRNSSKRMPYTRSSSY